MAAPFDRYRRFAGGLPGQPYQQLAWYYRRLGHDGQARLVLLAWQRARRARAGLPVRTWGLLQDWLAGYGYAPGRAVLWLACAFAAGWWYFARHPPSAIDTGHPATFHPALYTLDLISPAPLIGDVDAWSVAGAGLWLAVGLKALGWLLAIVVVAAVTRVLKRD